MAEVLPTTVRERPAVSIAPESRTFDDHINNSVSHDKCCTAPLRGYPQAPQLFAFHWLNHCRGFGRFALVGVGPLGHGEAGAVRFHAVELGLPSEILNFNIYPSSTLDEESGPPRLRSSEQSEEFAFEC
jgi:hypothetical protein